MIKRNFILNVIGFVKMNLVWVLKCGFRGVDKRVFRQIKTDFNIIIKNKIRTE